MADLNITITDAPRSAITVASPGPQGPAGAGLSPIADDRLLGNVSGSTATPSALNATQVKELLDYVSSADLLSALAEFAEENLSDISGGDANSIFEGSISGGEA